jgi:transmembrane sensor
MSDPVNPSETAGAGAETDRIETEAREWVARLTSGEISVAELAAFERWRAAGLAHRRAFARANLLWDVLGKVAEEAKAADARRRQVRPWINRPLGRRALLGGALAASAAYLAIKPPLHLWPAASELMAAHRTEKGERRQVAIASGITVDMDTQTSITKPASVDRHYALDLIAGQLAVAVDKAADRPVIVSAGGGQNRADRARFDVRWTGSSVCVTCIEGEVETSYRSRSMTLQARQQVSYDNGELGPVVTIDPAIATAWQRGQLIFRDVPLSEVIEEVNRYRAGRIVLLNSDLAQRRVVAGFRLDQIDDVVRYLTGAFGARTRSLPGGIVVVT